MLPRTKADLVRRGLAFVGILAAAMLLNTRLTAQKPHLTEKDILPVVQRCFQCHGEKVQMSGLDLHTKAGMLKGGSSGPAILPGNAAASPLYKRVTGQVQPVMPMAPVPALNEKEIAILKDWIDQGSEWNSLDTPATVATSASGAYKEKQITD